jgi:hypothetical protein
MQKSNFSLYALDRTLRALEVRIASSSPPMLFVSRSASVLVALAAPLATSAPKIAVRNARLADGGYSTPHTEHIADKSTEIVKSVSPAVPLESGPTG